MKKRKHVIGAMTASIALATVALATPALATAASAHAETSAARSHAATVGSAGERTGSSRAVPADDGLDVHRDKYLTLGGCQTAGQQGIERGHWDRFQCADGTWPFRWNLWTNR
ncbi:hypothetical protein [Streptomyces graminilatus]|uniref:hypothetical protein n=1 Tax=Streptomyces graminilatus TaxID=1464070 RepID=UPI0006E45BC4|nr:hypothetical protein [Streptomyces graminilatus]